MKWIKRAAALCILTMPATVFAGSVTGTITHLYIGAACSYCVYVEVSAAKTENPACSTNTSWQFVLLRGSTKYGSTPEPITFYNDLFTLFQIARGKGLTVTVTGAGTCTIADNTEDVAGVQIQ